MTAARRFSVILPRASRMWLAVLLVVGSSFVLTGAGETAIAVVARGNYPRRCGKPHRRDGDHRPRGFFG